MLKDVLKKALYHCPYLLTLFFPFQKYNHKNRCIFIHIPKCAGTSILNALQPCGGKVRRDHLIYLDYCRASPYLFSKYFTFTIVRNPYDRLVSLYQYLIDGGNGSSDYELQQVLLSEYPSFDRFVLDYLSFDRIHEHPLFRPQYLYVYDLFEHCQVEFIGRYEDLEKDTSTIFEHLGLSTSIQHLNKSSRETGWKEFYRNSKVAEQVNKLYAKDFQLLGYEKIC